MHEFTMTSCFFHCGDLETRGERNWPSILGKHIAPLPKISFQQSNFVSSKKFAESYIQVFGELSWTWLLLSPNVLKSSAGPCPESPRYQENLKGYLTTSATSACHTSQSYPRLIKSKLGNCNKQAWLGWKCW